MIIALPAYARAFLEGQLPNAAEVRWFTEVADAAANAPGVEVAWYDFVNAVAPREILERATSLKWMFTMGAGIESVPLDLLREHGTRLSNGTGLNAAVVADFAVMSLIAGIKQFPEIIRAQDRREWLTQAPGTGELDGSRALIVGYGRIGSAIGTRIAAFGVRVDAVRSKADPESGVLGPGDWQQQIGDYDWIFIGAPLTAATTALIGRAELAAMKPAAWIVNIARGKLIDRDAIYDALQSRSIGGAVLDVTDPEPLPPDDPLWTAPNAIITMHLSGRSQSKLIRRAAEFFLINLGRYRRGLPLENEIDFRREY